MTQQPDPAIKFRKLRDDIARKIATKPRVDAQGKRVGRVVFHKYDADGMLIGPVDTTEPPAAA